MALSGSFGNTFRTGYRLQIDWTATQNISANTSTVTAKLYLISQGSSYTIVSSATKDGSLNINGTSYTFSGAGLAKLAGNQKKLLMTKTVTLTHNSDGTKTFTLGGYFDLEVTIGSYYGRVSLTTTTFTLNTIPRKSSLTAGASWTAGGGTTFSISRASSSFTHDITIKVHNGTAYQTIKTITGVGTSYTWTPTTAEQETMFDCLNNDTTNWNQATQVTLTTKSGSAVVGSETHTGTLSSPVASTTASSLVKNIGDSTTIAITRANSSFKHTLRFYVGSKLIHTSTQKTVTTSYTWTPTSEEIQAMYAATPNSNSVTAKVEIDTYYRAQKVRSTTSKSGTFSVTNSNPEFGNAYTYSDNNPETVLITMNNTKIIQGKSTVLVSLPVTAKATAINGATMVNYIASLNGEEQTVPYSDTETVTFSFGTINASVDQVLSIKAVDSRGNFTSTTKTVEVIPYSLPKINATARRLNGFENETILNMNGSISPLTINSVQKNAVKSVQYRYKESSSYTWGSWTNFVFESTSGNYTATRVVLDLDNTKSYSIEYKVVDVMSAVTYAVTVSAGQPIFFIDSKKKSVGVGKFPIGSNKIEINGEVESDTVSANSVVSTNVTGSFVSATTVESNNVSAHVVSTDGIETNYVNININEDIGGSTQNAGLRVGDPSGANIKVDGNEILANTAGAPSNLHIQSEGGKVILWQNASEFPNLTFEDGYIKTESYIYPSLSNGWTNYSSSSNGFQKCSYWKDKFGTVHLSGLIRNGTASTVFTLPAGYRPANQHIFIAHGASSSSSKAYPPRIDVLANGNVNVTANLDSGWTSLAGIHFKAKA